MKEQVTFNEFIDLCIDFRNNNPESGDKPVFIDNIDAPGLLSEMSYFLPNGINRILTANNEICGISIGAGETPIQWKKHTPIKGHDCV